MEDIVELEEISEELEIKLKSIGKINLSINKTTESIIQKDAKIEDSGEKDKENVRIMEDDNMTEKSYSEEETFDKQLQWSVWSKNLPQDVDSGKEAILTFVKKNGWLNEIIRSEVKKEIERYNEKKIFNEKNLEEKINEIKDEIIELKKERTSEKEAEGNTNKGFFNHSMNNKNKKESIECEITENPDTYASRLKKNIDSDTRRREILRKVNIFAPRPEPEKIEKVYVSINVPFHVAKNRRELYSAVNFLLHELKIRDQIKNFSLIGRSIIEIYVKTSLKQAVIENFNKQSTIPSILQNFDVCKKPEHSSLTDLEHKKKVVERLSILYMRNLGKQVREAIFENVKEQWKMEAIQIANEKSRQLAAKATAYEVKLNEAEKGNND